MKGVPVARLSDGELIRELAESVAHGWMHTARQVTLIAEVERRRLYAPAGYPSMFAYCVGELHLSEDEAYKRIQAARTVRHYPQVLVAMAEGRIHLTGVVRLKPHLTAENVTELLDAAAHKSKTEIVKALAERFPSSDLPPRVAALAPAPVAGGLVPEPVVRELVPEPARGASASATDATAAPVPQQVPPPAADRARVAPLAPQRYGVQFTLDQAGHDLLRHVQNLLGNRVPPGDLAEVFVRALKAFAEQLEKQKFAATERPAKKHRHAGPDSRHIASDVKRKVWKRDKGQCTFVADNGKRCESRWDLEFDHEQEFARGGEATVANIRLRCRAHNQHAAERTYGVAFMEHRRAAATAQANGSAVT